MKKIFLFSVILTSFWIESMELTKNESKEEIAEFWEAQEVESLKDIAIKALLNRFLYKITDNKSRKCFL